MQVDNAPMLRRSFLSQFTSTFLAAYLPQAADGERLAKAAQAQVGVTTAYDPAYVRLSYPNGDPPRNTGVCADVVVRAGRDGIGLDLQKLVHEDMVHNFAAYPRIHGMRGPDSNIDHRRVLNLEAYWRRVGAQVWTAKLQTAGDAFPATLQVGDVLTWMIFGRLPHVGIVSALGPNGPLVVNNIGRGAEEVELGAFHAHPAKGHFRWPADYRSRSTT